MDLQSLRSEIPPATDEERKVNPTMKSCSGCLAILASLMGIAISVAVVSRLLIEVTRLDIAIILSVISILLVSSLLLIPGIMKLTHRRISARVAVVCGLTGATMMWTLVGLGATAVAMKTPDLGTFFYDAFPYLLALGLFGGLLTTCFGYAQYDMSKRPERKSSQPSSNTSEQV